MNAKAESSSGTLNTVKWLVVTVVLGGAVVGNWYYAEWPLIYRVLAVVALGAVALGVAAQTTQGAALTGLFREARVEVRKVVWPTHQETLQTTLIVVAGVLIMALLLWGLDTLLGWLASLIIG